MKPRVVLYCEFLGLYAHKTIGFIASYRNQLKVLAAQGVPFSEDPRAKGDIFQCNAQFVRSWWYLARAKRRGMKTIIYAHAAAEELPGSFWALGLLVPLYRRYLSYLYRQADAVMCVSEYNRNQMVHIYRVDPKKAHVISNGVDVRRFAPDADTRRAFRKAHGISDKDTLVINVAMAIRKKGTATFIALAKAFPDICFKWYGGVFSSWLAPAPKPESPNMEFAGFVEKIEAAYAAADVLVFPSFEENQGMSVIEAMAAGVPVIVRDIPVYRGWLIDGVNCMKAAREEEFGAKLQALLGDPELRARIARAGQKMAREEHSLEAVGARLMEVYAELLAK